MSKADDNNHNLLQKNQLAWLFVYLSIAAVLSFILPFPISWGVLLIVLISLNIIRAEMALRKAGIGGIKGWYKGFSSLGFSRGWGASNNSSTYKPLKFYCMNCGNEHKKITCPKCGSKAVRAS